MLGISQYFLPGVIIFFGNNTSELAWMMQADGFLENDKE